MRALQSVVFALGVVLALLPTVAPAPGADEAGARLALRLVGTAIAACALVSIAFRDTLLRWANVVLGLALVATLPLVGTHHSREVLVGVVVAALVAMLSTFGGSQQTGFRTPRRA